MPGIGGRGVLAKPTVATFLPSDIAGLAGWWDASNLGLADNDPISSFTDRSGNGRHATAATTKRPLYKTAIQNGLAVARFDGSDDEMTTAAVATAVTDNFTQITLLRQRTTVACVPIHNGGAGDGWGVAITTATGGAMGWLRGGVAWHDSGVSAGTTNPHLLVGRRASGTFKLYDGGGSPILTTTSAPAAPAGSTRFGGHVASNLGAIDLCEGLIYTAALSDADLNTLGAYLAAKWGLTWTNV